MQFLYAKKPGELSLIELCFVLAFAALMILAVYVVFMWIRGGIDLSVWKI